jgi:hypothetical protein
MSLFLVLHVICYELNEILKNMRRAAGRSPNANDQGEDKCPFISAAQRKETKLDVIWARNASRDALILDKTR